MQIRNLNLLILALFLTILTTSFCDDSDSAGDLSREEVIAKWEDYQPDHTGDEYITSPSTTAPYSAGELHPGFMDDGIKMTNFVRFLAGMPDDIVVDQDLAEQAQHGAVLIAASNFSHTPEQPSDMSDSFYDIGLTSTSSSNIYSSVPNLAYSVRGYMSDGDTGNMDRVGHRRWIINPPMQETVFGWADGPSVMQVFDSSRSETVDYETAKWPNSGDFPREFFAKSDPWSVTFNPEEFSQLELDSVSVTLEHVDTGTTWDLDADDNAVSSTDEYLNVNTQGFGVANTLIFRPAPGDIDSDDEDMPDGAEFHVTITGISYADGSSTEVSYTVRFFDLTDDE